MSFSNQEDESMNPDTPVTEGINVDGVVRPQGRKGTKEKKRRLNDEKSMVDALYYLQSTLEKQIMVNQEELELKREKDKKEFELRERTMKKEIELKEKAQKMKEKDQQWKEKDQQMKEKEEQMKEKAQKRQEQDCILNKDVNKLPQASSLNLGLVAAQGCISVIESRTERPAAALLLHDQNKVCSPWTKLNTVGDKKRNLGSQSRSEIGKTWNLLPYEEKAKFREPDVVEVTTINMPAEQPHHRDNDIPNNSDLPPTDEEIRGTTNHLGHEDQTI
ncbi:hypothetical protein EZV62_015199 [Acer yangbiense]|uniref:Uncharacterized protein n=1 Tax=Acer yangbiense TaxID=1000413 RepID=A0A5C7HWC5_9ROSI|nr:hypothetical protein EZV62_015199 [Acer yangbiense]